MAPYGDYTGAIPILVQLLKSPHTEVSCNIYAARLEPRKWLHWPNCVPIDKLHDGACAVSYALQREHRPMGGSATNRVLFEPVHGDSGMGVGGAPLRWE